MNRQDIEKWIWERTDPDRPVNEQVGLQLSGDMLLMSIAQMRQAHRNLLLLGTQGGPHADMFSAEVMASLELVEQNVEFLISDCANYLVAAQQCRCAACQAANAANN